MFKHGEIAGIKGTDRRVIVIRGVSDIPGSVETDQGIFKERDLYVTDPAVLRTAAGADNSMEDYLNLTAKGERIAPDLLSKVERLLTAAETDFRGHWKNGSLGDRDLLKRMLLHGDSISEKGAKALAESPLPLGHWVRVDFYWPHTCLCCGEGDFAWETNGAVLRIMGDPCPYPEGLPLTEWELNVPSGKLVVANDFRDLFPLLEEGVVDLNTAFGCRQMALAYAACGMSHAFVSNTNPGVYRCSDGTYKIANPPREEKWDPVENRYVEIDPIPVFDGVRVAGICTDLWWYSICDYAEFERRCAMFDQNPGGFNVSVVDVEPGVYRFRHDEQASWDYGTEEEVVYTRFEWVRSPDPVQEYLKEYQEIEVNPHAYVQAQALMWPTLYGRARPSATKRQVPVPWSEMTSEEQHRSWLRVAGSIFCVGNGTSWHKKGFPIPDVDPPSFRQQNGWYPFSESGGLFGRRSMTPSFAKLAFRVLESMISFGMSVHDSGHSRDVKGSRDRMRMAVRSYRSLATQYPDQADPEYMAWLSERGRAEAWVDNFDLGPEFTDKHRKIVERQRWVPEGAYAVEFDARKLHDGHFAWHPKRGGYWARKDDAQRYAIEQHESDSFWWCHASNTSVPLYIVARIAKVGEVSHMGETLVELVFDYGTSWMLDISKRKALRESGEKDGIRVLSKEEYAQLLPEAIRFFENAEAEIRE